MVSLSFVVISITTTICPIRSLPFMSLRSRSRTGIHKRISFIEMNMVLMILLHHSGAVFTWEKVKSYIRKKAKQKKPHFMPWGKVRRSA